MKNKKQLQININNVFSYLKLLNDINKLNQLKEIIYYHTNKKDETFHFQYSRYNRYSETWNEEGYYRKVFFNEQNDVIRI